MTGREVFVLGGGNSAGQAALFLSQFAASVTVLIRAPSSVRAIRVIRSNRSSRTSWRPAGGRSCAASSTAR